MVQFDNMNEQEQMQTLMSQLQDSNLRQSVMQYINQTANGLDKDANSKALIETLARESVHNQKSTAMWKSRTKKSVAVGVVAVVLAITVQFLVNYFTNELSKESHVDKQGAMVSTDGKVVKTQMEEMKVAADGKLLSRNGDASVKTMPTLAKVALASSLPDATLMALDEITVHSDKGYTFQIKVHGFSRVPVLNSRCGNVVHFYTAWKGKITLDSTDLSFDEATAAEFKNAGFSLATGGRRLAGKINVDGFAKALDGMKESGKWTCADVPLPTISELGDRKETSYTPCGAKNDKIEGHCRSSYGGFKVGVMALEGSLASAVARKTAQVQGKTTNQLYGKSSSAVMNSDLYRVSFSEYAMHPGQQLVAITDVASGKGVEFQIESDKSRSHCSVVAAGADKVMAEAQKDTKIDSDWHFEYMGTSEEEGSVLRHFRIMWSSEFVQYIFGDASSVSLPNFAEFWDVAETMQPHRLLLGDGGFTQFDSYKQGITDAEVDAAVKGRTGKTVAELMSCTEEDQFRDGRPEMSLFGELSQADADYYYENSRNKSEAYSEAFSKYLDSAWSSTAMPDFCYDACKTAVDAVKNSADDICQGTSLANALHCLQELPACLDSNFVQEHRLECTDDSTDNVQRTLEESEERESEEPVELLVNETQVAAVKSRNLFSFTCPGQRGGNANAGKLGIWQGAKYKNGEVRFAGWETFDPESSAKKNWFPSWCVKWSKKFSFGSFTLMIKWGRVSGFMGFAVELELCWNILSIFGITKPMVAEICVGGGIAMTMAFNCPGFKFLIKGHAHLTFSIGFDFWVCKITFAKVQLGFAGGIQWVKVPTACWWYHVDGKRRRRWWTRRRRRWKYCNYRNDCDLFLKGWLLIQLAIIKVVVEYKYLAKSKNKTVRLKLFAWAFKWFNPFNKILYENQFRDPKPDATESPAYREGDNHKRKEEAKK